MSRKNHSIHSSKRGFDRDSTSIAIDSTVRGQQFTAIMGDDAEAISLEETKYASARLSFVSACPLTTL